MLMIYPPFPPPKLQDTSLKYMTLLDYQHLNVNVIVPSYPFGMISVKVCKQIVTRTENPQKILQQGFRNTN